MEKEYYLGLDIGTQSVGWAVSDMNYNIPKFKGNAMWGIRLFDESNTAEDYRNFRGSRRRNERKKERLALLEQLFDEEISKVDIAFYQRLKESNLYLEDKSATVPYCVFADNDYTDKDFNRDFPTVYHLRSKLVHNKTPYDIRLVYLALHHIIKNRGHFLFDFDSDSLESIGNFDMVFDDMVNYINDNYLYDNDSIKIYLTDDDKVKLSNLLKNKNIGKSKKNAEITKIFSVTKKNDKQIYSMLALLSGSSVSLSDIFDDDSLKNAEKNKVSFSSGFDDNVIEYMSCLGDRFELIQKLKAVYDWAVLADVLNGNDYLCDAKVETYDKHKKDLEKLKNYVKEYLPNKKCDIFKNVSKENNYVAYSAHIKTNKSTGVLDHKCTQEEFCKYLKKVLGACKDDEYADMFIEIDNGTFMPKQVSKDNGVIPMQLNEIELKAILNNVKGYLPFLNSKDENGVSVSEKIIKIFEYRIPYYIGPLNNKSPRSWLVRSGEKIYPWNIEKVVDFEKSAEAFIENLTSKCSYLPKYDVIPKSSLLYSKYSVLNELNNLKINGEKISVELKQDIYNDLFMRYNKVSQTMLEKYLKSKQIDFVTLTGFDNSFKSSLKSFKDFEPFDLSYNEKDEIIKSITIFGDDKKLLRKRLNKDFSSKLTDNEINKISHLNYSGWGNLSKEFLTEIYATHKVSGDNINIITALWQTNYNLMELLYSEEFSCDNNGAKIIDKLAELNSFDCEKSLKDMVNELYVSPKVKRPVYQSLLITKEIDKIMKFPPKKIFVEVAKGPQEKKRTKSRKDRLIELYKSCKKDFDNIEEYNGLYSLLDSKSEDELRSDKLYLYFTQFGKCMYTGEEIDLELLMRKNSRYDIDHIYPKSKIKDDSLDNRVLVVKTENANKTNIYPLSSDIRNERKGFWSMLLKKELISKEKYNRLVRNEPLSDDELSAFVARQLVETRQSTKAVTNILGYFYPDTEIVYVKAALTSEMRQEYNMLKCRDVNDFHHAKDAYLNIVVGNVYNVKFTHNKVNFIKELQSNNKDYTVKLTSILNHNIPGAWVRDNEKSLNIVKNTMNKNNIRYTRYSFEKKGGFWDQTILKKGKAQLPINSNLNDVEKYGGRSKIGATYFCCVEHGKNKKRIVSLYPVNIYDKVRYEDNPVKYLAENYGLINPIVKVEKIKIQSCISFDNMRCHLGGKNSGGALVVYRPAIQLVLGYDNERYIRNVLKCASGDLHLKSSSNDEDTVTVEKNCKLYDLLCEKMSNRIYDIVFSDLSEKLVAQKEKFEKLELIEQCKIIKNILTILKNNASIGDLKSIDIKSNGAIRLNNNISEIKNVKSIKLINQSITGLYENEIELVSKNEV